MKDESLIIAPDAEELNESIDWLIRLRWVASVGVFIGALVSSYLMPGAIRLRYFLLISLTIFLLNLVFSLLNQKKIRFTRHQGFILLQIICDWVMLFAVIHLSGGMTSPGTILFVFHLLIAGFLCKRRMAYFLPFVAGGLLISHAFLVKRGMLNNYRSPFGDNFGDYSDLEILLLGLFLLIVFSITAHFAAVIAGRLRMREQERLQAMRSKLRFARMTHHQLRAPLAAVQSSLDALPYTGPLNEKQQELMSRAGKRIKDAFNTIRDLLDLAKAENIFDREERESGSVFQEAARNAMETAEERAAGKGVEIQFRVPKRPVHLRPGPDDIDRIISNLLDNAVKYTGKGGTVELVAEITGEHLLVSVRDSGIGIAPQDHARVFEGFYRTSEAKATEEAGTGLGLSIVKQLVNRWGGRVSLTSEPNQGSTFKVELPLEEDGRSRIQR